MNFEQQRKQMVEQHLEARGIADDRTLSAMRKVPREEFVPEDIRNFSYHDGPLPIDCGQSVSQPYIVGYMAELLDLDSNDRVLEIGTGSGYNAAVLSHIAREVYSVEVHEILAREAKELLERLEYKNVFIKHGDGHKGWEEKASFDAIMLTAAPKEIPEPLFQQLAEGGKLIAPVGEDSQYLFLYQKKNGAIEKTMLMPVRFMPMTRGSSTESGQFNKIDVR